jgi:hypothetical protein
MNRHNLTHHLGILLLAAVVVGLCYVTYRAYEEAARACAEIPE